MFTRRQNLRGEFAYSSMVSRIGENNVQFILLPQCPIRHFLNANPNKIPDFVKGLSFLIGLRQIFPK